jgi:hypothetical protein
MNLLERYVGAVKRYLPKKMREDIGEELYSLLEEKADAAAEAKGKALEQADYVALLREFGHPLAVASQYQKHRVLISEPLFPLYKQAVKYLLLTFATLYLMSGLIQVSGWAPWWPENVGGHIKVMGLWYLVILTACFHFLDSYLCKVDFFKKWKPQNLPHLATAWVNIPLGTSILTLALIVPWFALLTALSKDHSLAALTWQPGHLAGSFVLWLKVHAVLTFLVSAVHVFKPYWTPARLVFSAFLDVILVALLLKAMLTKDVVGQVFSKISDSAVVADPVKQEQLNSLVTHGNSIVQQSLWIGLLIVVAECVYYLWRTYKLVQKSHVE